MWGSPGTILAGRELGLDVTASIEWLHGRRDTEGLWTQRLYGRTSRFLGPAHGFAGCVLALGDVAAVSETLERLAVEEDGLVNWPPLAGTRLDANGDGLIRTQWCHGAPGIVATLAHVLDEELAVAGGELTWRAGPLQKGANLCHGTAGNGYAFLALFERTGDERWLTRARAFAMHAAGQVEQSRSDTDAAATRSGRATSARPSTSPTAPTAEESRRSRRTRRARRLSDDVEVDPRDADGLVRLPGPREPGDDDVVARRRRHPEVAALGAAEPLARLERRPGLVLDLVHAGRELEAPLVPGGRPRRDRQPDRLAGDAFDLELLRLDPELIHPPRHRPLRATSRASP